MRTRCVADTRTGMDSSTDPDGQQGKVDVRKGMVLSRLSCGHARGIIGTVWDPLQGRGRVVIGPPASDLKQEGHEVVLHEDGGVLIGRSEMLDDRKSLFAYRVLVATF